MPKAKPPFEKINRTHDLLVRLWGKQQTHFYGYPISWSRPDLPHMVYTPETLLFPEGGVVGHEIVYMARIQTADGYPWGMEKIGKCVYCDIDDYGVFMVGRFLTNRDWDNHPILKIVHQTLAKQMPYGLAPSSTRELVKMQGTQVLAFPILAFQLFHRIEKHEPAAQEDT